MVPQLLPWMIEHRRGTYVHVDGCRYRCLPCGKEVYFVRETLSSVDRVYEHEGSERHKKALVRWNASQSAGSQDTTAGAALVPLAPCCGHLLGQPGGAFESLQVGGGIPVVVPIKIRYPSHLFTSVACQESMHYWINQGCPMFKSEAAGCLSILLVQRCEEGVVIRHRDCSKEQCAGHCPSCAALPRNREAKEAIGQWCRRLDMASLLYRCACRSSDVPGFLEEMHGRDYVAHFKSCRQHVDRCTELFNTVGVAGLFDHCRRAWICLPSHNLTQQLRRYMELNIYGIEPLQASEAEAKALECLVQNVEAAKSDLEIAAWVAGGQLRKHVAVNALVSCFIDGERKRERGCERLGTGLDAETRMELMMQLGRSKAALDMQELFHVTTKGTASF